MMSEAAAPLRGKVAIVTGAARGIGRAIALRLARAGADIAVADVDLAGAKMWGEELTADSVPEEIERLGRRAIGITANLGRREQADDLVVQAVARLGKVDILVNCAGGAMTQFEDSFATTSPEQDRRLVFDANLNSMIYCCQAASRHLIASGEGAAIVNFSTSHGTPVTANGSLAFYLAAKAAVVSFTRSLAGELGPKGVRANVVSPGLTRSARVEKLAQSRPIGSQSQVDLVALRRWGEPDEIAKVVQFLVSDASSYITGQCLAVNGGLTLVPM
jgi:3-oxoacyl-[acyl-carrier protein] reductase